MTTLDAEALVPESYPTVAAALWQPERRLMIAVLEDAIDAYLVNAGAPRGIGRTRFEEASSWLRSEDADWPFSFVNICDACGIDPAVIRRMLIRQIQAELAGASRGSRGLGGRPRGRGASADGRSRSGSTWCWRSWVPNYTQASSGGGHLPA